MSITIEPSLLEHLQKGKVEYEQGFPGDKPVSMASYRRAAPVAVATMSLQRLPPYGRRFDEISLLVSLFAMPRLCRILTDYEKISEIEIHVRFYAQDAGRVKGTWRESLLDCFKEARGFGRAIIVDAQGNTYHRELVALMMSPFKHFRDVVDRASTYHDRALQKQNLGRLFESRCDYQDGRDFISWFLGSKCCPNSNLNHEMIAALSKLYTAIGFSCALLCIKLGDVDWALGLIEWTLGMQDEDEEGFSSAQTQGWFLYGMRDLAFGAGNGAIYCFLQTLWKQPGHPGADEAVDEMKLRLRSCPDLNERIILHNIEHVLKPFRHQARGSAVMSNEGYELLIQQWYAGRKEINSIGYLHCSDGSVSLDEETREMYFFRLP